MNAAVTTQCQRREAIGAHPARPDDTTPVECREFKVRRFSAASRPSALATKLETDERSKP